MKAKMVKAKLNGAYEIILPEHRAKRAEWYTEKGWEKERLTALKNIIADQRLNDVGPVVYYVGAEEGEMPALCQMWGAKVVLFEPNPRVWPNMKAIWDANKLEYPISFCGFASSRTNDLAHTSIYRGFPPSANGEVIGDHGFMNLSEIDQSRSAEVKIDDLTTIEGALQPTVITMDVEGSEWEVLRGAELTLRSHHPVIVLSLHPEFMYEMYHEYAFDCRSWIKGLGYKETLLDYQHEVHLLYEAAK